MKLRSYLLLALICASPLLASEPRILFFAKENPDEFTYVSLTIDGDRVSGTEVWQPHEKDGAHGPISGSIKGGGKLIQVLYSYTIEGSEQSEEQVFKLDGDTLYIGEGELVDKGNGNMKLKEPNKVSFTKALKQVPVTEPKAGSPERKAIMEAMRPKVAEHVGAPVLFTGNVRVTGEWARFQGNVDVARGSKAKSEDAAADLELDFFALLKKDANGSWKVMHSGFAGDISVWEEAREKFPQASWVLFE